MSTTAKDELDFPITVLEWLLIKIINVKSSNLLSEKYLVSATARD